MRVNMPNLEEIRKILDENGIASKVLPPNPQLYWVLFLMVFHKFYIVS